MRVAAATAGAIIIAFSVLAAIFAPLITPYSPNNQNLPERRAPPFWQDNGSISHPLGTDQFGRDVWSRLVYGARTSLIVALGALAISGSVSITLGLLFRYYRGPWDNIYSIDIPFPLRLIVPVVSLAACLYVALIFLGFISYFTHTPLKQALLPKTMASSSPGGLINRHSRESEYPCCRVSAYLPEPGVSEFPLSRE